MAGQEHHIPPHPSLVELGHRRREALDQLLFVWIPFVEASYQTTPKGQRAILLHKGGWIERILYEEFLVHVSWRLGCNIVSTRSLLSAHPSLTSHFWLLLRNLYPNLMKIYRKQVIYTLYQICVVGLIWKHRWPLLLLIAYDIFDVSSTTAEWYNVFDKSILQPEWWMNKLHKPRSDLHQ